MVLCLILTLYVTLNNKVIADNRKILFCSKIHISTGLLFENLRLLS